jgi:hypothetical protein
MRTLSLLFILAFFTTCHAVRYLPRTANNYSILPLEMYTLKDSFNLTDTSILSPSYFYSCCRCDGPFSHTFWYLRFFKDGKVAEYDTYKFESAKTYKLVSSSGGYYTLHGNILRIELPGGTVNTFRTRWYPIVYTAYINGDTIAYYKAQWNGKGPNDSHMLGVQEPYVKRRCDYLKSKEKYTFKYPDW